MITAAGVMDNEQIYRAYATELTRYATGLVGPFDAPDVVSDACLKVFQSKSWPRVTNRRAYLYKAVLSVANDHHRSTLSRRLREMKAAQPTVAQPEEIDVDDVRDVVRLEPKGSTPDNEKNSPGTLREFKESAERAFLVGKLRENNWNISKTAEVIGTPRSNLYKKLEQYGITQETDG